MLNADVINDAYGTLRTAQEQAYLHGERVIDAKSDVESKLLGRLADGSIVGKNQALRDAYAREVLASEYATLEIAEEANRTAKLDLDLARLEVDRLKMLLRLAELTTA